MDISNITSFITNNPLPVLITIPLVLLTYRYLLTLPPPSTHPAPTVHALSLSPTHTFTKPRATTLTLLPSLGVANDAHSGVHVQHLSRIKVPNTTPNLRQVHLLAQETLLAHDLQPGEIGENITTSSIDLLALGRDTALRFVPRGRETERGVLLQEAPCVVVTGLRNPCHQIDKFRKGLQEKFIERDEEGKISARKAGIMGVVTKGGEVEVGMSIVVEAPGKFVPLDVV